MLYKNRCKISKTLIIKDFWRILITNLLTNLSGLGQALKSASYLVFIYITNITIYIGLKG